MRNNILYSDMYSLTIEEAAQYFRLGENKLRQIIKDNQTANYILKNGNRTQIKRKLFEEFLNNQIAI